MTNKQTNKNVIIFTIIYVISSQPTNVQHFVQVEGSFSVGDSKICVNYVKTNNYWKFITIFTTAHCWSLFRVRANQSKFYHYASL